MRHNLCRVFHTLNSFVRRVPHVPSRLVGTPHGLKLFRLLRRLIRSFLCLSNPYTSSCKACFIKRFLLFLVDMLDDTDKILHPQPQVNWATELKSIVEEHGIVLGVSINHYDTMRTPAFGEVIWMHEVCPSGNLWLHRLEGASEKKTEIEFNQGDNIPYSHICERISNAIQSLDT